MNVDLDYHATKFFAGKEGYYIPAPNILNESPWKIPPRKVVVKSARSYYLSTYLTLEDLETSKVFEINLTKIATGMSKGKKNTDRFYLAKSLE